jgi:hypothetical protein
MKVQQDSFLVFEEKWFSLRKNVIGVRVFDVVNENAGVSGA